MSPDLGVSDAVFAALSGRTGIQIELPILLPAATVLDLAGEGLRSRLFFAGGADGEEFCLRPDLTLPAAQWLLDQPASTADITLVHAGKVFRAPHPGEAAPPEFLQVGLERFGDTDPVTAECDVVLRAMAACRAGGLRRATVTFSDAGLLDYLLTNAALPEPWGTLLLREAGRPAMLRHRLEEAATPGRTKVGAFAAGMVALDDSAATDSVDEVLAISGLSTGATRSAGEIAARLRQKAIRASAPALDPATVSAVRQVLDMSQPLSEALTALTGQLTALGVDPAPWRDAWSARLDCLRAAGADWLGQARFQMGKSRSFGYYDGMTFDITEPGASRPAASGGRYDGLIGRLSGGARHSTAVGAVVRPQRLAANGPGAGW